MENVLSKIMIKIYGRNTPGRIKIMYNSKKIELSNLNFLTDRFFQGRHFSRGSLHRGLFSRRLGLVPSFFPAGFLPGGFLPWGIFPVTK